MQLLEPLPEQQVALADQDAVPQLWKAKKRCRRKQEAVLLCGILDASRETFNMAPVGHSER